MRPRIRKMFKISRLEAPCKKRVAYSLAIARLILVPVIFLAVYYLFVMGRIVDRIVNVDAPAAEAGRTSFGRDIRSPPRNAKLRSIPGPRISREKPGIAHKREANQVVLRTLSLPKKPLFRRARCSRSISAAIRIRQFRQWANEGKNRRPEFERQFGLRKDLDDLVKGAETQKKNGSS